MKLFTSYLKLQRSKHIQPILSLFKIINQDLFFKLKHFIEKKLLKHLYSSYESYVVRNI